MPIKVYSLGNPETELAWLCDEEWQLAAQVRVLEAWLKSEGRNLPNGDYVADVGFQWRKHASGGGSAVSPEAMRTMADIGIRLYLSEYPGFCDETDRKPA